MPISSSTTPAPLADYLEQLCDAFPDAICISDHNGIAVLLNKRHAELSGVPPERILGQPVQKLVTEGVFDVVLNPQVVREKKPVTCVQKVANGRQLVLNGHPILDGKGEVRFVINFIRDITLLSNLKSEISQQKELLEAFQRLNREKAKEPPLIMESQAMRLLYEEIGSLADTDVTALVLGETGVGKDVVARAIHARSRRSDRVFIKIDCGSIPENLIETELFGYVGGTFSGANKQGKIGLIEAAASGTLFLDEIGELPLQAQSRLLRFLQDREVMRVGATCAKTVDARIIAATNKDLQLAVNKGAFRSDLYYRLKVAVVSIPPLRKRRDAIVPMAQSFLDFFAAKYEKKVRFSEEALAVLRAYAWPGNVRELENMVQRMVILSKGGVIEASDLPIAAPSEKSPESGLDFHGVSLEGRSLKDIMRDLESAVIAAGVRRYGSMAEAARHFQVDRTTLFRKVKEKGGA